MPPIPVYTSAPIHKQQQQGQPPTTTGTKSTTATKPTGTTPQTAAAIAPAVQPSPTQPFPQFTPATTTQNASYPPPPQPGARPQPPYMAAPTSSLDSLSTIPDPPAPQPGSHPQTVTKTYVETVSRQPPPPPQMGYQPPVEGNVHTRSTSTSSWQSGRMGPGPTTLNMGPATRARSGSNISGGVPEGHSLEHPPNYVQNPYAAEGSVAQRNALHDAAARERADSGVMGTMKEIGKDVGESLRTAEEAIWKWVGGKS